MALRDIHCCSKRMDLISYSFEAEDMSSLASGVASALGTVGGAASTDRRIHWCHS